MQKDKTPTSAVHHSSGGRKVPVSAAERAAGKRPSLPEPRDGGDVIRPRADAEADAEEMIERRRD